MVIAYSPVSTTGNFQKTLPVTVADLDRSTTRSLSHGLKILALVGVWWIAAASVTTIIKETVSRVGDVEPLFPYPIALTSMTNSAAAVFLHILAAVLSATGVIKRSTGVLSWQEWARLAAIGTFEGACNSLANSALKLLTLSMRTVMLSNLPLMQMITARLWGLERLGGRRLLSGSLLVIGGTLQTRDALEAKSWAEVISAPDAQLFGVMILLSGMLLGAQQWALTQSMLQDADSDSHLRSMSKMEMSGCILPASAATCAVLALLLEADAFSTGWTHKELAIAGRVGLISTGIAAISVSELMLVQLTSAVALQVIAGLHQLPIVFLAVTLLDEQVSLTTFIGLCFCVAGAMIYGIARRKEAEATTSPPTPQDDHIMGDGCVLCELGVDGADLLDTPEE